MAPVVGRSPSATFSRDLVTLNRGREEVPADSARCPLTNEGPLERALTLVSRQKPSIRGATTRRERERVTMSYLPPPGQRARPATLETTAWGRQCEHQPQRQSRDRDAAQGQGTVPSDEESGK